MTVSPIHGESRRFHVSSQSRPLDLLVDLDEFNGAGWCSCEDYEARHWRRNRDGMKSQCKHILAAIEYENQTKNPTRRSQAPNPQTRGTRPDPPRLPMEPEKRPTVDA